MQTKLFKLLGAIMLVAFLSGFVSGALAVGQPSLNQSNGKADVTTDQATISVTGGSNVPFYHIQLKNDNKSYEVKFEQSLEFVPTSSSGAFSPSEVVAQSTKSFPGAGWTFSGFNTTNDTNGNIANVNFNFTHAASTSVNPTSSLPSISLNNHIDMTNGNQIKFDILMSQYKWVSTNTSAKLAIKMQIAGGNLSSSSSGKLSFGNAYFDSVSSASTPSGNVNVGLQVDTGSTFYIIVDHFDGNFTLDPLFGAVATSTGSSSGSSSTNTAANTGSAPGFEILPVLAGLAIIGVVYTKKKS